MRARRAQVVVIVALAFCAAVMPSGATPQKDIEIRVENGRISMQATGVRLSDLLARLGAATGLELSGTDVLTQRTAIDVTDMPLLTVLAALLQDTDYVLLERPGSQDGGPPRLQLHVLAEKRHPSTSDVTSRPAPVRVPALEAHAAAEKAEEHENRLDEEQDPDWDDERRDNRLEASRLAAEGAFKPEADLRSVLALMDNEDNPQVRLAALHALASRDAASARRRIAEALGDDDWDVRTAAVDVLGRAQDRDSLAILDRMLETNADPTVRIGVLRVLALRAVSSPSLRVAVQDSEPVIREAAAQLLAELERRRGTDPRRR